MTDYSASIAKVSKAASLEDIQHIAAGYPAKGTGKCGILYSGRVGDTKSETIALALAEKTGYSVINSTPRAGFLVAAEGAIKTRVADILESQGMARPESEAAASNFLYGSGSAPAGSATSLRGCLWGQASHEFATSLQGDVVLVASAASPDRVFGQVEVPAVLNDSQVASLGKQPVADLRAANAQGGTKAVLPKVQASFVRAAPRGIFNAKGGSDVVLAKEAADALGVDSSNMPSLSEALSSGMTLAPIGMGRPAARLTDMHTCPMTTGSVPHVGGPICSPGAPKVLIGGLPAARVGDMAICVGPPDSVSAGSSKVTVGGQPVARLGDATAHGGVVVLGCFSVLFGG